jgi:hypothetical protein
VVRELSLGACNKEIAQRLQVAEKTVKTHLTAIFRKLGIYGRVNVALFVNDRKRAWLAGRHSIQDMAQPNPNVVSLLDQKSQPLGMRRHGTRVYRLRRWSAAR